MRTTIAQVRSVAKHVNAHFNHYELKVERRYGCTNIDIGFKKGHALHSNLVGGLTKSQAYDCLRTALIAIELLERERKTGAGK